MMQKFEFTGIDGQKLSARLDEPADGHIKAYALFAHCFTCGKDLMGAREIAKALNEAGIALVRFDFTGLGSSEGEFENTNFSSNIQDLMAAVEHMREELEAPQLLIGHSLGGTAVLAAARSIPEAKALATIGSPCDPAHVSHQFEAFKDQIEKDGEADVQLAGRPFKIKKQFLEDITSQKMNDHIKNLRKALLVCHSPIDDTVNISNASHIFVTAKHPKSFLSLDKADHLLMRKEDAQYVASVIATWALRYIS